ncbi:MAG: hypothetical protein R3B47_18535 [Bacteroidia bacterium]
MNTTVWATRLPTDSASGEQAAPAVVGAAACEGSLGRRLDKLLLALDVAHLKRQRPFFRFSPTF